MAQFFHGLHTHQTSIEHVWDALDQCTQQRVPVPANIQELCTAIEEEWHNIPQVSDSVQVFTALVRSIERSQTELIEVIEEKQKAAER